jgi:RimJ/RimL family protein N-acetyltransferase
MIKERRTAGAEDRLIGAQVRLRPVTALDLALLERWDQDPELEALMGRRFSQLQPTDWLRQHLVGRSGVAWMIEESATGRPVGELELANLNRGASTAEVRICLGEQEVRGHGYGREALGLALRFAFVTWNLRSLHLRVYASNSRAIHLYERIGFRRVGIAPPSDRRGDSGPILLMEISREKWHRLQEAG